MNRIYSAFLVLIAVVGGFLTGCGKSTTAQEVSLVSKVEASAPPPNTREVKIRPDMILDIKTGLPGFRPVSETLSVAGRIEVNEHLMTRVTAPTDGRLIQLNVTEGQQVQAGQVVATIYSTELATAQSEFLKATTGKQQTERAVARAKQLLSAGVIGSAELQRREAEGVQAATDLASLRKQLQVLGMPDEAIEKLETTRTIDSMTQVVAAAAGLVVERPVTQGQVVEAAQPICVLADLSSVWLIGEVPEEHARSVYVGKTVHAEVPAMPGQKLTGTLTYVSATVNPATRTILTRMDLANADRRFKPAMLATVLLMDNAQPRLTVPSSAVVRNGEEESVFLKTAPDTYLLERVTLGEEIGDRRVVLSGLATDSTIVTEGAFHLNNERLRQSGRADAVE